MYPNNRYWTNYDKCAKKCPITKQKMYSCDTPGKPCSEDDNGKYDSYEDCQNECTVVPSPTSKRYSCDTPGKPCSEDDNGKYDSYEDCESECKVKEEKKKKFNIILLFIVFFLIVLCIMIFFKYKHRLL